MCVNELTPALNTTFISKDLRGTRLIAVPKGKNFKDWAIRSQAPTSNVMVMEKVQRLNGYGLEKFDTFL